MANHFDVWLVGQNLVYKQVPYGVVADWVQQGRVGADDRLKPSGTGDWKSLADLPAFQAYESRPEPDRVGDTAEALEPIELDFPWKRRVEDEDDDVDMIPLIDISLVLLIFFMMTTTVAAISRIAVPSMEHALKIDTRREVLRIDIDLVNGAPVYGVGKGTAAPADGDGELRDLTVLIARAKTILGTYTAEPNVRIAAHGDLPYETVDAVMKELEKLRRDGQIDNYTIEVNERAPR
jgi:biopolymer transport protein ExbD